MSDTDKKPSDSDETPTRTEPSSAEDVVRGDTGVAPEDLGDDAMNDAAPGEETPISTGAPRDHADGDEKLDPEDAADRELSKAWPNPPEGQGGGPADAVRSAIMGLVPAGMGPYLQLSRFDRPVGFWLLALPCFIGLAFARVDEGWRLIDLLWLVLFGFGAIAMRGAGCTWNDIQDRKIDAEVERTKGRPLPSGALSVGQAWMWLGVQLLVGFLVWLCLPGDAKIVALLAIPLVAAYPFMKKITWWPQAWLGLTFNWGVLVAAATAGDVTLLSVLLYLGLALWTIGYDTIYAVSDREDDALIGVKSTARLFEGQTGLAVFCFYLGSAATVGLASWIAGAGRIGALAVLAFMLHGLWQVIRLKRSKEADALPIFRSNVTAGAILFVGFAIAALFGYGKAERAEADRAASIEREAAIASAPPRVYRATDEIARDIPPKKEWWLARMAAERVESEARDASSAEPPADAESRGLFSDFMRGQTDAEPDSGPDAEDGGN